MLAALVRGPARHPPQAPIAPGGAVSKPIKERFARARRARFDGRMPEPTRQKITFADMHASSVGALLTYSSDYHCSHWTAISGDRWPDDVRLNEIEPKSSGGAKMLA